MEAIKRVFIQVVTWNHAMYLPGLFRSLDAQTSDEWSMTVIDNASTDGTLAWIQESRPECGLLRNFRNQGFARAHNQGIALALSRWGEEKDLDKCYCFLLNPDTILDVDCIAEIIAFMDTHPNVMIAGPKMYRAMHRNDGDGEAIDPERTKVFDSAGIVLKKNRVASERGVNEEDVGQYDGTNPFGISGAGMVIRASAIRQLSMDRDAPFDEDFFAYKEDIDLCWRARLFGLDIALIPRAIFWHYRYARESGIKGPIGLLIGQRGRSSFVNALSRRNQIWMEWKNDDLSSRLMHVPWRAWRMVLGFIAMIFFPSHAKGVFQAYAGCRVIKEKRKEIQKRRTVTPEQMRHWFV